MPAGVSRRWVLAAGVALLVAGPPFALFRAQYAHAKRFREVSPGRFYRSGQMTAPGFREVVARYGIKTVINLQNEDKNPQLLDHWLGTAFLLPVGIVGGMALSLYLIWFRYGTH